jgi:hypothetical protein
MKPVLGAALLLIYPFVWACELALTPFFPAPTWEQEPNKPATRPYTMEEYNAQAAPLHVGDPRQKTALLDAFVSKYPDSELLVFIYPQYCDAYRQLGDLPRVMKYAERALASSEKLKLDVNTRFESAITWVWAYNNLRSNDVALAAKARNIAGIGLELIAAIESEDVLHQKTFPEELRKARLYLNTTAAAAAMTMKDYQAASDSLAIAVALSMYDPSGLRPLPPPF